MSRSRDIVQSLLIAVAVIILITIMLSLVGCLSVSDTRNSDDGSMVLEADCDANTIYFTLDIDEQMDTKDAALER